MDPLEQRVKELEDKLARYDRIFSLTASQLIIHKPIVVKGTIGVGGPSGADNQGAMIMVGPGNPDGSIAAPEGSIWMRNNGGASTSIYGNDNGGTSWHAL